MKSKPSDRRMKEYVYSLAKPVARSHAFMAAAVTISDDGPAPMKNMRPVPKHPNGPDKFASEHRYDYESHSHADPCDKVNEHNNAYPKLKDELDKRRSLAKITAMTQTCRRAIAGYEIKCKNCKRCVKLSKAKIQKNGKNNNQRRKVTKNKRRTRKRGVVYSMANYRRSKECQHLTELMHRGTSPKTSVVFIKMADDSVTNDTGESGTRENSELRSGSNINNGPDTEPSNPSITTYNSFLSMDHEPMV